MTDWFCSSGSLSLVASLALPDDFGRRSMIVWVSGSSTLEEGKWKEYSPTWTIDIGNSDSRWALVNWWVLSEGHQAIFSCVKWNNQGPNFNIESSFKIGLHTILCGFRKFFAWLLRVYGLRNSLSLIISLLWYTTICWVKYWYDLTVSCFHLFMPIFSLLQSTEAGT